MDEREHRRNILIIMATILAVLLLAGANIAVLVARPADGGDDTAARRMEASIPSSGVEHQDPLEVCERLAPEATAAYTGKGADRDRLIARYFTSDAQGLNVPADRIAEQPDVPASGGLNVGDSTTAVCSVWTGLESPWTLTWRWDARDGWRCTGISGPLEGAYAVLGDTAPGEDGGGE